MHVDARRPLAAKSDHVLSHVLSVVSGNKPGDSGSTAEDSILTEGGDALMTEDGDFLVIESEAIPGSV